jgi:hypothetical protein
MAEKYERVLDLAFGEEYKQASELLLKLDVDPKSLVEYVNELHEDDEMRASRLLDVSLVLVELIKEKN